MEHQHRFRRILNKLKPKHDVESKAQPSLKSQLHESDHGLPQSSTSPNHHTSNSGGQLRNNSQSRPSRRRLSKTNRAQNGVVSHPKPVDLPTPRISQSNGVDKPLPRQPKEADMPNEKEYPKGMEFLTLGDVGRPFTEPSPKLHSENAANGNSLFSETGAFPEPPPSHSHQRSVSFRSHPRGSLDQFSEDVANRNISDSTDARPSMTVPDPEKSKPNEVPLEQHTNSASNKVASPIPEKAHGHQPKSFSDFDFTNTTDTDVTVKHAPAVTHETVYPVHHEIREEQITREIHNHDVYHRILPIREVEVLPARHFTRSSSGTLTEIPAPKGRSGEQQNWQIVQTTPDRSSIQPPSSRRQFTARNFEGDEGSHKEYMGKEGVLRTETTWIHPPTVEDGGQQTGQTVPLHIDETRHPLSDDDNQGPTGSPGGRSDGVPEPDPQFFSNFCDPPDMSKQLRRRPVTAEV